MVSTFSQEGSQQYELATAATVERRQNILWQNNCMDQQEQKVPLQLWGSSASSGVAAQWVLAQNGNGKRTPGSGPSMILGLTSWATGLGIVIAITPWILVVQQPQLNQKRAIQWGVGFVHLTTCT